MDFSKRYLLKYGWEEGQGLGKFKDGIKIALKPKLKFDKAGMGFDPSTEFTDSWWVKGYNDALGNTNVENEEGTKVKTEENEIKDNTNKSNTKKRKSEIIDSTDLFKACEGRTVHKGARLGLKLSGKIQRLEQQELHLQLKKEKNMEKESDTCCSSSRPTEGNIISTRKDKGKHKRKNLCD